MTGKMRRRGRAEAVLRVTKYFYLKVMRNSGAPEYIARGAAVGIFVGFFVPMGLQVGAAILAAFLCRAAKIPAVVLTFISNYATNVVIYPVQCWVGGYLIFRPFHWTELVGKLDRVLEEQTLHSLLALGGPVVLAFFAGGLLFGVASAVPVYGVTLRLARRYRARRAERLRRKKDAGKKL